MQTDLHTGGECSSLFLAHKSNDPFSHCFVSKRDSINKGSRSQRKRMRKPYTSRKFSAFTFFCSPELCFDLALTELNGSSYRSPFLQNPVISHFRVKNQIILKSSPEINIVQWETFFFFAISIQKHRNYTLKWDFSSFLLSLPCSLVRTLKEKKARTGEKGITVGIAPHALAVVWLIQGV